MSKGYDVSVGTILRPTFYKEFACIGKACKNTCCAGWNISFDRKDYQKIKKAMETPALASASEKTMRRLRPKDEGQNGNLFAEFVLNEQARCTLLSEEGLCRLQLTCGEKTLPHVCRVFPRLKGYTPAAVEESLSPGCEVVLQLLWDKREGIDFEEIPLGEEQQITAKDVPAIRVAFGAIRSVCIDVLQDRSLKLSHRLLVLGILLNKLLEQDWETPDIEGWLGLCHGMIGNPDVEAALETLSGNRNLFLTNNNKLLMQLITGDQYHSLVELVRALTVAINREEESIVLDSALYEAHQKWFDKKFSDLDYFYENLLVTVFFNLYLPRLDSKEELWKGYVNLCNLYSFYRFASVGICDEGTEKGDLIQILTKVSRLLLHDKAGRMALCEEFFENDSASLAHMAILVSE